MTEHDSYRKILARIPRVMLYDDSLNRVDLLRRILKQLGSPDKTFPTIHICGTNGKGSTSTMIAQILQNEGYRVGLFTSPSLLDEREDIQYNRRMIAEDEFLAAYDVLIQEMAGMNLTQADISFFETWYLVAIIFFAQKHVDYAVIECGLGGELDATNATSNVKFAVFTKIALDHMKILGNTIEEIATAKSKIIKSDSMSVIDYPAQASVAHDIIAARAKEQHAKLWVDQDFEINLLSSDLASNLIDVRLNGRWHRALKFSLAGKYQIDDLATVLKWCSAFNASEPRKIKDASILAMINSVTFPGRMEELSSKPTLVIDGAHNVNGIDALVKTLLTVIPNRKLTVLVGFLRDKQVALCVDRLLDLPLATFVVSTPDNPERAMSSDELYRIFQENGKMQQGHLVYKAPHASAAVDYIRANADDQMIYAAVGSFYFINQVKMAWDSRGPQATQ